MSMYERFMFPGPLLFFCRMNSTVTGLGLLSIQILLHTTARVVHCCAGFEGGRRLLALYRQLQRDPLRPDWAWKPVGKS